MFYVLLIYPNLDESLVGRLRRRYDPTTDVIQPHVAVVFPVPESVGRDSLISHIEAVTADWRPFEIRLGGLNKSPDHWLFLTLTQGCESVRRLYRPLHTGVLAEFRIAESSFVPRLALGLFLREGATYDWENPRAETFDAETSQVALSEAQPLLEGSAELVDTLHLVAIPDEVVEWFGGERSTFSPNLRAEEVHAFRIGRS
jgi:hypothetical protein